MTNKMRLFKKISVLSLVIMLFGFWLGNQPVHAQVLYDDFNDNTINSSLWTDVHGGSGPTIDEINQRLEITHPAASSGDTFFAQYTSICQLRGDFDIQVDYQLLTWPSANGVRIGLNIAGVGATERVSFGTSADFPGQPREVYLTHYADGVQGITATDHLVGKLRVVRSGNTLTGYYFSFGNWVAIHTGPATTDDVNFIVASWSHDYAFTNQEVKVAFDNVIVNQGQLICPETRVSIDIKPGSDPNSINLGSRGNVPVAILSDSTFDATAVDRSTVIFAGASPLPVGQTPEDVNGDGLLDVVLHFKTQDLNLQIGDTEACLTGKTFSGQEFEGCDSVRIVK